MGQKQIVELRRPEVMRWMIMIVIMVMILPCALIAVSTLQASPLTSLLMVMFVLGGGWLVRALLMSDASAIMFDGERLYDDAGTELCRFDEIADIERGMALFKPSGGFVVVLNTAKPRGWSPGLWWRWGRRIGIGGATPGRLAKHMADAITGALASRMIDP